MNRESNFFKKRKKGTFSNSKPLMKILIQELQNIQEILWIKINNLLENCEKKERNDN